MAESRQAHCGKLRGPAKKSQARPVKPAVPRKPDQPIAAVKQAANV
jgi:hypothetical protein